jgi:hypothetical protein
MIRRNPEGPDPFTTLFPTQFCFYMSNLGEKIVKSIWKDLNKKKEGMIVNYDRWTLKFKPVDDENPNLVEMWFEKKTENSKIKIPYGQILLRKRDPENGITGMTYQDLKLFFFFLERGPRVANPYIDKIHIYIPDDYL